MQISMNVLALVQMILGALLIVAGVIATGFGTVDPTVATGVIGLGTGMLPTAIVGGRAGVSVVKPDATATAPQDAQEATTPAKKAAATRKARAAASATQTAP